ncbi:MAG: hypothetical protein JJE52_01640 [Acidimicrobiia bacterium]|nr:hypothetical protein [Acidimicrobiia bacterium]
MSAAHPVRALAAVVAAMAIVALGVIVGPGAEPASACSCATPIDAEAFAQSDAVFVGTVVGSESGEPTGPFADPVTWTIAVSEVYKGQVAADQEVVSERSVNACGVFLPTDAEVVVFATRASRSVDSGPDQYYTGLCSGSRSTIHHPLELEAAPTAVFANNPPSDEVSSAVDDVTVSDATTPQAASDSDRSGWVLALVAIAGIGIVAATALVIRRLRRG